MTNSSPKPLDWAFILKIGRDLIAAALIGWLASELTELVLQEQVFPRYGRTEWYADFLSFAKMMVGAIVGGLVCVGAVHLRVMQGRAKGEGDS